MMKDECHDDIKPYFNYKEELIVVDGLYSKVSVLLSQTS